MREPMRTADVTVKHKRNGFKVVTIYCVGDNPTKIAENKTFRNRIFQEYYSDNKKRSDDTLTILKIKLNAITGYTTENANWGTTNVQKGN